MCDVMRDLQNPPLCTLPYFFRLLPLLEREVLYARRKTFLTHHSEAQPTYYSAHAGCYSPIQELCFCLPLRLDTPCT